MAENGTWFAAEVATLGDRLAGARDAAGLTQEQLAGRLGVRLTTLQAWEEDMAEPRGNRLQMLAGMLNVSLTWLIMAEGDGLQDPDAPAMPKEAQAVLADLQRLRARAAGLVDEVALIENNLKALLRRQAA